MGRKTKILSLKEAVSLINDGDQIFTGGWTVVRRPMGLVYEMVRQRKKNRYGNINSTCIGDYAKPIKRFEGSGGACDIAILAHKTIIIMTHEVKRFVEHVDYLTSPGWMVHQYPDGKLISREEAGLWGGPYVVVSTLGVMKFHPKTHEMYVESYFADMGVTPEEIRRNTGFPIDVSQAKPLEPPTEEELNVLRQVVDPEGIFMKY